MRIKGGMDGDAASLFWLMEIRKSAIIRTGKGRFAGHECPRRMNSRNAKLRSDLYAKGFGYEMSNGYGNRGKFPGGKGALKKA